MNVEERRKYARRAAEFSRKFLLSGKGKKAEHLMQKAIHFAPEKATHYNQYGLLLMCLSRFKEAEEHFNKALDLCSSPGSLERELTAYVYHNRGVCFLLGKKFKPALSDVMKAIELLPKSMPLWQQKSFILLRLGDFSKALESAEIAIMLDDSFAYSHCLCAFAHFSLRNFRESLKEVEKGLKLSVNDRDSTEVFLEIKRQISDIQQKYGDSLPDDKTQKIRVLH